MIKNLILALLIVVCCGRLVGAVERYTTDCSNLFLCCVEEIDTGITGVVITRNIYDKAEGREWVIVITKDDNHETMWIDELKTIPCSQIDFDEFPEEYKIEIEKLLLGICE